VADGVEDAVAVVAGAAVTGGATITVRVIGGAGVTGSGLGALETEDVAAGCAGARRAGRCDFARGAGGADAAEVRAGGGAAVLAGASPEVTDSGSPARPIRVAASRLADQATVAVAAIPSSAAATHNNVRRFTAGPSYSASG
jgi:hypothetical protein